MRLLLTVCVMAMCVSACNASTLDGYDRAKLADENYAKMHGDSPMYEAADDPELAAMMKKYIYGDLSRQINLN